MSVTFVGRREELATLRTLISAARRVGAPTAALVTGEPGSGKSRLLREVLRDMEPRRRVLMSGFEPTQPIPLAAASELIRRLVTVPGHGPRLEAMVFSESKWTGQGALPAFEAAARALAAFGPLVLAIDDLQWVDDQSVALVFYLLSAAQSSGRPLVVVAGSRPSSNAATYENGLVGYLPDARRALLRLRGLELGDGVALAQSIDASLDDQAAEQLWNRAAGSPFWLDALARSRTTGDPLETVTDRLRSLSGDASSLLNTLVIGARPFAQQQLMALLDWPEARLSEAARELTRSGLAVDEQAAIRISHDLIREAALPSIPESVRRSIHSRLANELEQSALDDLSQLAEAMDHRSSAGRPVVDLAMRMLASPQRRLLGAADLDRLSSIADALAPGSIEQRALDEGIAGLAVDAGERERAIRHWSRIASSTESPALRQRAHLEAARAGFEGGNPADVYRHLAEARSLPVRPVMAIQLDSIEAHVRREDENDVVGAAVPAANAVDRSRTLILEAGGVDGLDPEARAAVIDAFLVAAGVAEQEERPKELIDLSAEALSMADGLSEDARLPVVLAWAFALSAVGRLAEAEEWYRRAWDTSQRLMLPRSMVEAALYLAMVLRDRGRLAEARSVAREVDALQARIRPWLWGAMGETVVHFVDLSLGDARAASRARASVISMADHFGLEIREGVAVWMARQAGVGRAADVDDELKAAHAASARVGCPGCARRLDAVTAEALARIERIDEAMSRLADYEATYHGPMYPARRVLAASARAAIAIAGDRGDTIEALDELDEALDVCGRSVDAIWAQLDRGAVLKRRGDRQHAIAVYKAAASRAEALGAAGLERIAARALRELGVRAWRRNATARGDGALADLSRREREVARLVAGGSSNREIGESLALSPKTVERHLTNILTKLGARNRTELAARVLASPGTGFPR